METGAKVVPGMKHQTTACLVPLHLQARAYQALQNIQQHRKRSNRDNIWPQKVPSLLLCERGEYNYRSQTTSSNLQKMM